jgi:hypothetical protein
VKTFRRQGMDSLFKEEMFENIKMGRYFQAFESLKAKLEEKDTYSLYTEWWATKTKEESEVLDKAYDYEEEYFSDLRLIDYKDELFAVKIFNGQKFIDSFEGEDILYKLTIGDGWRFKLVDYDDETCGGLTSYTEKLVEISNKYNNKDTLLHEMIHLYELILKSYQLDDFVLLKLYDELLPKIKNLNKLMNLDKHIAFKEHSLLFILKSIKLDLKLGYNLGTIYAYGREDLYADNFI